MTDVDRLLETLDDAECRRLLGSGRLGRLGFTDGALPAIVPVPFVLDGDSIVIPARPGDTVLGAVRGSVVAFAVDSYDLDSGTGWGVTAVGPSRVVLGSRPDTAPSATPDALLGGGGRPCTIVVRVGLLRGWRLSFPPGLPPATAAAVPDPRAGIR